VLHHPLSGDVTDGSQSATVTSMFVYKIKNWYVWACPLQHSLLQVGAQVVYLLKTWHPVSPQLERCLELQTKERLRAILKIWN